MNIKIDKLHDRGPSLPNTGRRLLGATALAVVASSAANLALYLAAGRLFPEVGAWPGASLGQIVGANVVYLLAGAVVLAVIKRISARPARHFSIVAATGLLLSLALPLGAGFGYGPPGIPAAGLATVITLSLMHVISFAIAVPTFVHMVLD